LELPPESAAALDDRADGPVTMGIRPEHIRPDGAFVAGSPGSAIHAGVDVVEPLGSEILVYLAAGEQTMIAKIEPSVMPRVGETMDVALDLERVHFFDADTGESLTD
jgi:multiple sugar transport system ATP-binding protein